MKSHDNEHIAPRSLMNMYMKLTTLASLKPSRMTAMLAMSLALLPLVGEAAMIPVPNFSFELPDVPADSHQFGNPVDWSSVTTGTLQSSNTRVRDESTSPLTNQLGNQYVGINVDGLNDDPVPFGERALTSAVLGTYAANTLYTLTVGVAQDNTSGSGNRNIGISLYDGTAGARVADNTFDSQTVSTSQFDDRTVQLDTSLNTGLVGNDIRIQLFHQIVSYEFGRIAKFDNVRLETAVIPEPKTVILFLLGGMVGLTGLLRKRG